MLTMEWLQTVAEIKIKKIQKLPTSRYPQRSWSIKTAVHNALMTFFRANEHDIGSFNFNKID